MQIVRKGYAVKLAWRLVLLAMTIAISVWAFVARWYMPGVILAGVTGLQLYFLFRFNIRTYEEVSEFVESVRYKDFSRHFNVREAPAELQPLREGFNNINDAIKVLSKEKETQYLYLQKMLELIDTGILSFEKETGVVIWLNEALKRMLQLPYLRAVQLLEKRHPEVLRGVLAIKPGEREIITIDTDKTKIMLSATAFQTEGKNYKLIAFQNINEALDETELKAWQKLLSVMTHEIMNSVAPISSLAQTLKQRIGTGDTEDLELGIDTIQRRSEGLLKFAETYRNLSKITKPHLQPVSVSELFANVLTLLSPTLSQKNIVVETIQKDISLKLNADKNLIEQVLINLVVNAMDAVKETDMPRITLSAYPTNDNKVVVRVTDNGPGIPAELMEKIFVPFFSTKKNGSGIGLSLCRQIMLLHRGNIFARSSAGGSSLLLQFP